MLSYCGVKASWLSSEPQPSARAGLRTAADSSWGGEASLGDSGAYSYGMAYVDIHDIEGTCE